MTPDLALLLADARRVLTAVQPLCAHLIVRRINKVCPREVTNG